MGRKIVEWYISNKTKLLTAIFIIVVIILVSIIVNFLNTLQLNKEQTNAETNDNMQENNIPIENYTDIHIEDSESAITGENMSSSQISTIGTINQFVQLCNEENVSEAYNMLSDECKEEVYPSLDSFSNNYYNAIFKGKKKNITVENWVNNIYKVTFESDALSTGVYTQDGTIQDYITITKNESNEFKLNINNYIGILNMCFGKNIVLTNFYYAVICSIIAVISILIILVIKLVVFYKKDEIKGIKLKTEDRNISVPLIG